MNIEPENIDLWKYKNGRVISVVGGEPDQYSIKELISYLKCR